MFLKQLIYVRIGGLWYHTYKHMINGFSLIEMVKVIKHKYKRKPKKKTVRSKVMKRRSIYAASTKGAGINATSMYSEAAKYAASNQSVRANIQGNIQGNNANSSSARAQMLSNMAMQLPIIAQSPNNNVNWDMINNMRNNNDARQQQINDFKRAKDDENAIQKQLDRLEQSIISKDNENKLLSKQNKDLEKKNAILEHKNKEADRLSSISRELMIENNQLTNTLDAKQLKSDRDIALAYNAELKMNIDNLNHQIETNQIKIDIDRYNKENRELAAKKKALQETNQKLNSNAGIANLANAQHEYNLKKRQVDILEKRNKFLADKQELELKRLSMLTPEELNKLTTEEQQQLNAVIEKNIGLEASIRQLSDEHAIYDKQHRLLQEEKLKGVDLQKQYMEQKRIDEIHDSLSIDDDLDKTIKSNVETEHKTKRLKELNDSNEKLYNSLKTSRTAEHEANYYTTKDSINMMNQIIEAEQQAAVMDKKTEAYNDLDKANKTLQRSRIARSKAEYLIGNQDASVVAQVSYIEDELAKANDEALGHVDKAIQMNASIQEKLDTLNTMNPAYAQEFINARPAYSGYNNNPANFSLDYLQRLDHDLQGFIDYKNNHH